jgi:hypothetical protein
MGTGRLVYADWRCVAVASAVKVRIQGGLEEKKPNTFSGEAAAHDPHTLAVVMLGHIRAMKRREFNGPRRRLDVSQGVR